MAIDFASASGNITAATVTDIVELAVAGYRTVAIQLTGTFVGTLTFECTVNNDTWVAFGVGTAAAQGTIVTTATAPGVWIGQCAGLLKVRVNCSAYTSGAVVASLSASN